MNNFKCINVCIFFTLLSNHANVNAEPASSQQAQQDIWSYTVLKNDSLLKIKQKYLVKNSDILALSQLNRLNQRHVIQPNQVLLIPISMLQKLPTSVEIVLAEGEASLMQPDQALFNKIMLKNDAPMLVQQGTQLKTGKNGLIKLRFADGSMSNVQPNSMMKIESCYQYAGKLNHVIHLKLSAGRTEIVANPQHQEDHHLEVETPSAVAVVRGTEFRVGAESATMIEETLDGQVSFSSADANVEVKKDFGTVSINGQAPLEPIKLPDAPETKNLTSIFDALPVAFTLTPSSENKTWIAQLAKDEAFSQLMDVQEVPVSDNATAQSLIFGDLADGDYFLKLRAKDVHGLQSKDAIHPFNVHARPLPPILLLPANDVILASEPIKMQWESPLNTSGYIVQIAKDAEFKQLLLTRYVSFSTLQLEKTLPSGEYFWRVAFKPKPTEHQLSLNKFSIIRKFSRM